MTISTSTPRAQPRRRRIVVGLLLGVLVLLALLVVADRVAKTVVEHRLAAQIEQSQHLAARPDVTIHGFPFLTQVIGGRYRHVSLRARGPITEQGVQVTDASVELHGVSVNAGQALRGTVSSLPVQSTTGSAFVSYAQLTNTLNQYTSGLGLALTIRGTTPGHAVISGPLGLSVNVTASVTDNKLKIVADPADLKSLPVFVQPTVTSALNNPIALPPFPFDVTLSSVQLEPGGLQLRAAAHDSDFPI